MAFYTWSKTASSNATADITINWAEGQSPSSVNDSARAMMARTAEYRDDQAGTLTTGGTATAYTLTSNEVFDTLAHLNGQRLCIRFNATSGASPTLNVDSLGAKALQTASGAAIPTGMITANSVWDVTYDNSIPAFLLHDVPAVLPATSFAGLVTITSGGITVSSGVVTLPDGSVSAPAITFAGSNNGFYGIGSNNIGLTLNGAKVVDYSTSGVAVTGTFSASSTVTASNGLTVSAGSVSLPSASVADSALASPGALKKISAVVASSQSSVDFTSGIDSTYREYIFALDNVLPSSGNVNLLMEVSEDAGGTWKTTDYFCGIVNATSAGTVGGAASTTAIQLSTTQISATGSFGWTGRVSLPTPSSSSVRKYVSFHGAALRQGDLVADYCFGGGHYNGDGGAINGVRFVFSSGNVASGTVTMYGVKG